MPWEGYNYEDAIILSGPREGRRPHVDPDRRARGDARDTKLGARRSPGTSSNLSEEIPRRLGTKRALSRRCRGRAADVLVASVTPKGETEQTPRKACYRAIFGEKPVRSETPA